MQWMDVTGFSPGSFARLWASPSDLFFKVNVEGTKMFLLLPSKKIFPNSFTHPVPQFLVLQSTTLYRKMIHAPLVLIMIMISQNVWLKSWCSIMPLKGCRH
jgi:hypothetical protein